VFKVIQWQTRRNGTFWLMILVTEQAVLNSLLGLLKLKINASFSR
jgi:hypothetical protein